MELSKEHFRAFLYLDIQRGVSCVDIYQHLQDTHAAGIPSPATVFRWHKDFSDGSRVDFGECSPNGGPVLCSSDEVSVKLQEML